MKAPALALLLAAVALADDPCTNSRCDIAACPCGCECGNATDPGVCYSPGAAEETSAALPTVLVTGATGRTGSLLYKSLKASKYTVRAYVRSVDKAKSKLGCNKCDASEGIYIGDVNDTAALQKAALGASVVAIAVGAGPSQTPAQQKEIEFNGVQNQVGALAQPANLKSMGGVNGLKVVLCSSMGTTQPNPDPKEGGSILFWKLNAEAFIGASSLPYAIVKPCGLVDTKGNASTLLIGHDDTLLKTSPPLVSRADVAAMMAAAIAAPTPPHHSMALRFDLCSKPGPPPASVGALLETAKYPWQ